MTALRFEAEVRLIRWGESSSAGRTITLELPPDDGAAHPFRGFPTGHTGGQRFRMQFDAIDDSEQLAPPNSPASSKPSPSEGEGISNPKYQERATVAGKDRTSEPQSKLAGETHKDRRPWETLPPQTKAGILCSDGGFQKYVRELTGWTADEQAATVWLREELGILSRKELEGRPDLEAKLGEIRADFMEWAGRVSVPVR